jgi:hypothetical protein
MMVGSILSNFWVALCTFTVYFLYTFQKPESPVNILIGALIAAIVGFVGMFLVRFLIGYILFSPELTTDDEDEFVTNERTREQSHHKQKTASINEIDMDSEEIAKVVKTMMNR